MIQYHLSKNVGSLNVTKNKNQYTFGYPCKPKEYECSPYTVHLIPGIYLFEVWGAKGGRWFGQGKASTPGLGGYTSGILRLNKSLTLFLYVGATSYFNQVFKYRFDGANIIGGASSDIRVYANESFDWSDPLSLRSRIMVSGGGGGAEWPNNFGGHGGGLEGGIGLSDCSFSGRWCNNYKSGGGTQTSGGTAAPSNGQVRGIPGLFGISPMNYESRDFGAVGGNGYYSGASMDGAGAAGGGSSFISGHEGCIALNGPEDETPNPTNSSIHYTGYFFTNTNMIQGNKMMPLYYDPASIGIGNNGNGAIRITIISKDLCSCNNKSFCSFNIFLIFYSWLTTSD